MKLSLLASFKLSHSPATAAHCSRRHGQTLSANSQACPPTPALSLRPQKNQPHWLAPSTSSSAPLASWLFSFLRPHFTAPLAPFSCLFKLQVASNPA